MQLEYFDCKFAMPSGEIEDHPYSLKATQECPVDQVWFYMYTKMINAQKSSISFSSKTPPEIRSGVKDQLGIEKEGGVRKYLDLPKHFEDPSILERKRKTSSCRLLIGRKRKQLAGQPNSSQLRVRRQCFSLCFQLLHLLLWHVLSSPSTCAKGYNQY